MELYTPNNIQESYYRRSTITHRKRAEKTKWIKENIKMRKCKTFVVKYNDTCHCGYKREDHSPSVQHGSEWDKENDTETKETNAFGEIEFFGCGQKIGKFVRVDHKTPMETIIKLITTQWNLSLPSLLISVTGGAKNFQMKPRLKEVFRRGLVKVARSTGAWVTSAGLHAGVMKHVGEAIRDYGFVLSGKDKVVAIGIAPWGCVQFKELLEKKEGSWPAKYFITNDHNKKVSPLDPNHSHFILVDNGTQNIFGTEIEFRAHLEKTLASKKIRETEEVKIPAVVVMVEGGLGTLETVFSSTSCHTPVIVVKGSGRAADILAYAYETVFRNVEEENNKDITDGAIPEPLKNDIREKIIQEFGNNSNVTEFLKYVCGSLDHPNLVTIFEMDSKNSVQDIDMAILKALLKANDYKLQNLRLTLEWNRVDIAKNEIFADEIFWESGTLDKFMFFALHEDRVDFVKLFMEYGVSLKTFLSTKCLTELYNKIQKNTWLYNLFELASKNKKMDTLTMDDVASLINFLMNDDYFSYCYKTYAREYLYPANELFLWSVLLNRRDMAFLFWKETMEALPAALVAHKLLKALKLRSKDHDQMIQLQEHADLFKERAIGVLTECYSSDEKMTLDLLVQERQNWSNATCMLIAVNADNKKFISQAPCQSLLSNIWMGKIKKCNSSWKLLLCIFCPLFIFLLKFDENSSSEENNKDHKGSKSHDKSNSSNGSTCYKVCSRVMSFYKTPVITFYGNLIFYIIFLGIYSYVVLVELKSQISPLEWLLFFWIFAIFTEEIHQICIRSSMLTKSSPTLWKKFVNYISDTWNIVDVITITLFVIGTILRYAGLADAARVVLSFNLISFYFRLLHMFSIHQELGPKLVMIKKMMRDLGYFFVILLVFMVAYGIASQAILFPSTPMSYDLFKGVFKKAYFQMYGELFLEEYESTPNCNKTTHRCPSKIGSYIVPVLLGLYILLTNILLLNLLIAMFSYTFQNVQENTDLHWHFQRYSLIFEYYTRPPLPPPLIIFNNIYLLCQYLFKKKFNLPYHRKSGFRKKFDFNEEKRLIHWEDEMADCYLSKKEKIDSNSMYEKVVSSSNRIDQLTLKLEELQHQMQYSKNENSQKISSPKPTMDISKDVSISRQKLQNIEKKINNIDTSLEWIKQKLTEEKMAPVKILEGCGDQEISV